MNKKSLTLSLALPLALLVTLFGLSFNSVAADNILIIGGGGEHDADKTIFDDSLQNLGNYLKSSAKWEQSISFNHGHTKTEKILTKTFSATNEPFTKAEYAKQIAAFKLKIENSKPGEQFLVYLDSHGAKNKGSEASHSVATNTGLVSIDNLAELTAIAKTKNVKLAILDFSCHSGNSIKLAKDDDTTCVITSSSPNNFGFTDFTNNFTNNMDKGKNLEEIFLKTRAATNSRGLPMINTPAGKMVQDKQLQIESSLYFDLNDPITKINKLDDYMRLKLKQDSCKEFTPDKDLMDLISKAEELSISTKKILFWSYTSKDNFSSLKESLKKYAAFQNELKKSYLKLKDFETLKFSFPVPGGTQTYTLDELYNINADSMINAYQNSINTAPTPSNANYYRKYKNMFEAVKLKQNEMLKSPEGEKLLAVHAEIKNKSQKADGLSTLIASQERDFYSSIYKSFQKDEAIINAKNPCRDFIL